MFVNISGKCKVEFQTVQCLYKEITLSLCLSPFLLDSGADGILPELKLLSDLIILANKSLSLHSLSILFTF
uniref:Uncharacterized protein n=1 Tax=Amphimedon queenslandica TaxID=400682 RepID=A0A1X7VFA8_AMPQE